MTKIYFDGSCEPVNPGGNMGWGVVVMEGGDRLDPNDPMKVIRKEKGFQAAAPQNSNNVAEYLACSLALSMVWKCADKFEPVVILGDSQLVIKQMSGEWKMKGGRYLNIAKQCQEDLQDLINEGFIITFQWIPRKENQKADDLSRAQFKSRNIKEGVYGKR